MLIGAVADDLTGATDLALTLTAGGMRTIQVIDVPDDPASLADYDAVVVALKSRTIPAAEAIAMSLASAKALRAAGCRQLFFKYCSTFDSTDQGNIGPVSEALMALTGADLTLACPAFPTNARTIYMGNLFVGDVPLAESSMRDHPLTPMRDSNLVRVLQRQTTLKVGLVPYPAVDAGREAIASAFAEARKRGEKILVVDAITDRHLIEIGAAARDFALITGGSGVAIGLPRNFVATGAFSPAETPARMAAPIGRAAILAGSCSQATRGQVRAAIGAGIPALRIAPQDLAESRQSAATILSWALRQPAEAPVLVYSSDEPDAVRTAQETLGREASGDIIERTLADVARGLRANGFTRLIVAGGETSGAVVGGLGVAMLEIGPQIAPGVPWTRAIGTDDMVLALKSGNFGAEDFFIKAWDRLN
ncbi:3-oxo-tetronate kinase [Microbaculum marinisediminis]|uniref:3-oxo-tetronate kinase n=1 Tax=Microbaculum marinisediminis TaxID=2931392 RepID=A0AAW5R1T3_9HYPH|nr:3-oxo-tetronate kinase [Microbaculum sp. A6E488]MCT8973092.1 four-carbon acid sugar kinase family protein [Microbaculum sp. A6E488]